MLSHSIKEHDLAIFYVHPKEHTFATLKRHHLTYKSQIYNTRLARNPLVLEVTARWRKDILEVACNRFSTYVEERETVKEDM